MKLYNLRERTGFCVFSETGDDLNRFINALKNSPLKFFGLCVRKGRIYGYVNSCDYEELCELVKEHRLNIMKVSRKGAVYFTRKYNRRYGFLLGFVLAAALTLFLNDRVMIIEIGGAENIPESRVISELKSAGIYTGSSISAVDLRLAERQILAMDKDIDWIGIKHIGSRVTVEISEHDSPPVTERKNTPCNIVAARDGQIESVKIYNGMLIPMVGDGVKKGDVIVSGVVDTKFGRSYYVHSMGEITGIYTEKMTFSQPLEDEEDFPSGEIIRKSAVIFGKEFPIGKSAPPKGRYECVTEEKKTRFMGLTLPFSVAEKRYIITEKKTVHLTEKQAEEKIKERIKAYEKNFLGDAEITDRKLTKSFDGKKITVTAVYSLRGEIGEERMIFAKYEDFEGREENED